MRWRKMITLNKFNNSYTKCQNINWEKLIKLWKKFEIKILKRVFWYPLVEIVLKQNRLKMENKYFKFMGTTLVYTYLYWNLS